MEAGAIDHMAIDVKDIEKVYEMINQAGLNTTNDTVPFSSLLGKRSKVLYN